MIRKVMRYQTADGECFADEQKALEHVADKCREVVELRLRPLMGLGKMSTNEQYRAVMALVPDAKSAYELARKLLSNFTEAAEENYEEY